MKFPKFGLLLKFAVSLSLLIITTASLLTFFLVLQEKIRVAGDLKDKGYLLAKNLAYSSEYGVLKKDIKYLKQLVRDLTASDDIAYAQILDSKGRLLTKWQKETKVKGSVFNISVPVESFRPGRFAARESKESEGYAELIGEIKLGVSLAKVDDVMSQIFQIVFEITFGIVLLGIAGVYLITRYFLAAPLKKFVVGTRKIAEGDLSHKIMISSDDEIGDLAYSFNQMTDKLRKTKNEIEAYAKMLEEKVKERTKDLANAVQELKIVDRMKTEFLSIVSHELKTPLTPIHEYTALLAEKILGPLNEKQKDALSVIKRQSTHLANLMDNILDISRVEIGKPFPTKKELVSFVNVLKEIEEAVASNIEKAGLSFEKEISENLPTVYADENALTRLFLNLIGNAIKFTPRNGKIKVTVSADKSAVKCCVSDTGIGIAHENLEKIFDKFYQVDSSYTREAGGLGMGLAIAKGIVDAHNGRIWAQSPGLGYGATICFQIPLS